MTKLQTPRMKAKNLPHPPGLISAKPNLARPTTAINKKTKPEIKKKLVKDELVIALRKLIGLVRYCKLFNYSDRLIVSSCLILMPHAPPVRERKQALTFVQKLLQVGSENAADASILKKVGLFQV